MARIVLHTFGSFGDLHPYLAIAARLRSRGHEPAIATSEFYRAKVVGEGIGFHGIRPDIGELLNDGALLRKLWHPRRGTEYLLRDYVLPAVEQSYADLLEACAGADLLLTHTAGYAGPVVAEKLGLRWLSVALQPTVFMSVYDPPVLAPAPWLRHFYRFGRMPFAAAIAIAKRETRRWAEPIFRLRRRIGLPGVRANPIFEGQFSPFGTLALFSRHFAQPQPDWPLRVHVAGFAFYDRPGAVAGLKPANELEALERFLRDGPPPVLFTLGSSAVMQPGGFFRESIAAAQKLGIRAVLLVGGSGSRPQLPESMFAASYVPYSEIMPQAAAIVHQGGIGTTGQALRAGRPMLVVPWAHDQPDNAERIRKRGVGRMIPRARYTAGRAARELSRLLEDDGRAQRARELGAEIAAEDGAAEACGVIEEMLACNGKFG
ncbi:MAG: glycosyltransferase [Bryobacteraceae bacterium]